MIGGYIIPLWHLHIFTVLKLSKYQLLVLGLTERFHERLGSGWNAIVKEIDIQLIVCSYFRVLSLNSIARIQDGTFDELVSLKQL
jgi:hypothetical protein